MKRLVFSLFGLLCITSFAFADFDTNFKKSIKELTNVDVEVQFKKALKSFDGQYFVIGRTKGGDIFPVIVDKNGQYFMGLSSVMNFSKEDSKIIMDAINEAGEAKMKEDSKALNKLFKEFKESDFITFSGEGKNLPTKIIVTDPDCPYCRKELQNIEKRLKEANLKLIFAPVNEQDAFIKAQLILNATKNAKDNKAKIAILRKYFQDDVKLSAKEKKTDITQVKFTTEKIFGSGLINGVPFIFDVE